MQVSAGLAVVVKREGVARLLLCHPTRAPWRGTYSIPKGLLEPGEEPVAAAVRETAEEVGLEVPMDRVRPGGTVDYVDKRGRLFKKLHWYVVDGTDLGIPDVIPARQLQRAEVDWAGLLTRQEAELRIFHRFRPLLGLLEAS